MQKTSLGLRYTTGRAQLLILDQSQLPSQEIWLDVKSSSQMVAIIQRLRVRGAPLIGVAAALALAVEAKLNDNPELLLEASHRLRGARPTAVNLMNALNRMNLVLKSQSTNLFESLEIEAMAIFDEELKSSERMAEHGQALISEGDRIVTHCNTGGLVTIGLGTALSVPILFHKRGGSVHVYVDETRPLLQGARLNTWELQKHGLPFTLICDNMAASLMAKGGIRSVFVGADRITANGDFANKIGTYSLAIAAKYHDVKFYVVAPTSTLDLHSLSGQEVIVEERSPEEVKGIHIGEMKLSWSHASSPAWNPSFDVTPNDLVTAYVTENGCFTPQEFRNFYGKQSRLEHLSTHL